MGMVTGDGNGMCSIS